ncbi:hypothetical protein [Thiorhodovibrio winogradskyi]|uniref:hypothetical protein n=1 Tax=Thiorhodovibrio winogradskyi TaxID=77007 RepID=UPI002E2DA0FB|nr:hypothetical protein [Thiorhodovibrio winogradskyi]
MLIELHRLAVILLRVGKQIAGHILPRGDLNDRLSRNALVHVQRNRIDREALGLALSSPFQPGFVVAQCVRQETRLRLGQRALTGDIQQLGQSIRAARRVEPQARIAPWAVGILNRIELGYPAIRRDLGGRCILALVRITVVLDIKTRQIKPPLASTLGVIADFRIIFAPPRHAVFLSKSMSMDTHWEPDCTGSGGSEDKRLTPSRAGPKIRDTLKSPA